MKIEVYYWHLILFAGVFGTGVSQENYFPPVIHEAYVKTIPIARSVDEVVICGALNIVLLNDSTETIRIEGSKAAVNSARLKVRHGRIKISTFLLALTNEKPVIMLSLRHLKRLKILDDARVESRGILRAGNLEILMDADGKVQLELVANTLETRIRGRGIVQIKGTFRQIKTQSTSDGWQINQYQAVMDEAPLVNNPGILPQY